MYVEIMWLLIPPDSERRETFEVLRPLLCGVLAQAFTCLESITKACQYLIEFLLDSI